MGRWRKVRASWLVLTALMIANSASADGQPVPRGYSIPVIDLAGQKARQTKIS